MFIDFIVAYFILFLLFMVFVKTNNHYLIKFNSKIRKTKCFRLHV